MQHASALMAVEDSSVGGPQRAASYSSYPSIDDDTRFFCDFMFLFFLFIILLFVEDTILYGRAIKR